VGIRNEACWNSFFLSVKKWRERTGAIGLYASTGRCGGTFAQKAQIQFVYASEADLSNVALFGNTASYRLRQLNAIATVQVRSLLASSTVKRLSAPNNKP
jgi:hypothetical protein